ncbi:heme-binding protein [Halomonas sp. PR-M31]|uniref:GlcG/HbpS family heme-binding protein n=1 Tax=Halomonas sp. PR-M31 TaxID=1471202 RepID=UPI000651F285|nr:heme-binding protein [Halomonas sp. PR-M31]
MQQKSVLTLDDANAILDAAQQEAETNGWAITVAVVDDGGHLLGLRRLDGCPPVSSYVASEKARTAALSRRETQIIEEMINNGRTAFVSAPAMHGMLTGGVPVLVDGQVAGAAGVSGVKPDQDAQVVKAGIQAISS